MVLKAEVNETLGSIEYGVDPNINDSNQWTLFSGISISNNQLVFNDTGSSALGTLDASFEGEGDYMIEFDMAEVDPNGVGFYFYLGTDTYLQSAYKVESPVVGINTIKMFTKFTDLEFRIHSSEFLTGVTCKFNSIKIRNVQKNYEPIDIFDDFKISYNHIFNDHKDIASRKTPYTNSFKIPLSERNRRLFQLPFDLTYPNVYEIDGIVEKNDGTKVFNGIYTIKNVVSNVLQPYINIDMIDVLSHKINKLNSLFFYDTLKGEGNVFKLEDINQYSVDNHPFKDTSPFVFAFYNYNNRMSTYAYDPKRDINQLQPTWIVSDLIKMLFNEVDVKINSKFLFDDNEIFQGVKSTDLGLTLPCRFFNDSQSIVSTFVKTRDLTPTYGGTISKGLYSSIGSSQVLEFEDFTSQLNNTDGAKFNFHRKHIMTIHGGYNEYYETSMVDGEVTIKASSITPTGNKAFFRLGALYDSVNSKWFKVVSIPSGQTFEPLEVYLVVARYELDELYQKTFKSTSAEFDINNGLLVGTANISSSVIGDNLNFDIDFIQDAEFKIQMKANESITLALVLKSKEGTEFVVNYNVSDGSVNQNVTMRIKDAMIMYDTTDTELVGDLQNIDSNVPNNILTLSMEFQKPTELQPLRFMDYYNGDKFVKSDVDLYESYKNSENKLKVMDIVKMVMDRFNLDLFTRPDGSIHLDTYKNRVVGEEIIDYLIDESITTNFEHREIGLLSISDDSPSFYEADYNSLKDHVVNEDYKDTISLKTKSSIVNPKMFKDEYYGGGYELLKLNNSSEFWGISDRKQVEVKNLKPAFCFFEDKDDLKVFYPTNIHGSTMEGSLSAFLNTFHDGGLDLKYEASVLKECYSLKSFEDNEILGINSTYNAQWYKRMQSLLDENVTTISTDIYISEDKLADFMRFPKIKYFGGEWAMQSFEDYNIADFNGSVAKINLTEIITGDSSFKCPMKLLFGSTGYGDPNSAATSPTGTSLQLNVLGDNTPTIEVGYKVTTTQGDIYDGGGLYRQLVSYIGGTAVVAINSHGIVTYINYA